ncbi:acetyl-CoA carboxylase biotin carboxyl carrier protein [Saprospiraceae bacterium]|jgi:acetyl-CoA carboxylase biotin carboxyl carrier protein|nr:acetyl-CoA carboxylase biotin carboxyl carrier protein [Bacteroidota bacterium]MDB4728351.1 acetyl-CoA carboxylase biotin carboxyl carrier protein [Saprospiraceae bacterium]MDF1863753.1 acetyl-CoA carboxylase biotin carboxyl carrier protein [Saprospiraceae bacterium]
MNFKEIQELIKLINKMNLTEFKMKDGDFELAVRTEKYLKTRTTQVVSSPAPMMQVAAPAPQPEPIVAAPAPVPSTPAPAKSEDASTPKETGNYLEIKSPIVGTFYRSQSPDKPAYAKVGDSVAVGDVVCIVEAMKLFNEIESEVSGKIVKVLLEDAQPVEYDQVLFLVEPS